MRQTIRISVLLAIILLSIHTTESYVRIQTGDGSPIAWNLVNPRTPIVSNGRVTYNLDSLGSDDVPFCQVEQAITSSFQTWEDVPTSAIAFQRGPNITSDKTNLPEAFDLFWLEDSTIIVDGEEEIDISGALAVSFIGSENGEIIDLFVVFNGNQFTWATDGKSGAIDVREVATHEIGHCIGLDHSPIGTSTMFPTTGFGRIQNRSLTFDDRFAASAVYPAAGFPSSTGTISGRVLDNNGNPIFGAHVVAVLVSGGSPFASTLSQPDGTYTIQGLPATNYNIYAQPLGSDSNPLFNRFALSPFYSGINTDFQTSPDFPVLVIQDATVTLDIPVIRGAPAFEAYLIYDDSGGGFSNVASSVITGGGNFIGVIGPGLPQSGSPITISGPQVVTVGQPTFGSINGLPYIIVQVITPSTAPATTRNIIINNGTQRAIVTGGLEVIPSPTGLVVGSQADFSRRVSPGSLAVARGLNLATTTAGPTCTPLPTSIAGTSILVTDSAGIERAAAITSVSPNQVNFQIPPATAIGTASVRLITGTGNTIWGPGNTATTTISINQVAPALFTIDGTGTDLGLADGYVIRFRSDGTTSEEPIARFDEATGTYVPIPIYPGPPSDRVLLVLFGTGFRNHSQLPRVSIGGVDCQVVFAGPNGSPPFIYDQVNVFLDPGIGSGPANVVMTVDGQQSNTVTVSITDRLLPSVTSIVSQADYSPRVAPESLAAAFGSNLATSTASSGSNPLPTSLAGTSIIILDSGGTTRLAPLMYVSPNQVNFQIAPGTLPGPATLTFRNGTGGTATTTINVQTVAPAIFTVDGSIPNGFAYRVRADGTGSYEPIARRDSGTNTFVPVPIDLGPATDLIILGVYGTGIRRGVSPTVTIGGVSCQVIFAGPTGVAGVDQMNIILDRSLIGRGLVDVVFNVDEQPSNTVSISIQ
jgi:uncharacterized protein (TIGR03437 family)